MIKKEIKLKRIRKINHQTEKENSLIYPTLNKKYKINNSNGFIKSNINTTFKRKINTKNNYIRTSSAFLKRNYHNYLSKIMQKNSSMNGVMFRKNQLDSLLYKLKKYSNELQTYNYHKLQKLNLLKDTLKQNELKLNKLLELQDIELPDEKISIKNFNEIKLSKEDIENKIYKLIEEKEKIDYSLKNEEEYNRTVEYMLEDEKNRFLSIKKESNNIEEKIRNLQKYQKIVNDNMMLYDKREEKFQKLDKKIIKDIKLVQKVKDEQDLNNDKVQNIINVKENKLKELEENVRKLKSYKNTDLKLSKIELKEKVENAKEIERKRINDEKKCIEIIYCLYLIQKFINEGHSFDKYKLEQSNEYQLLLLMNNEENMMIKNEVKRYKNNEENKYISDEDIKLKEGKGPLNSIFSNTNYKNMLSTTSIDETKFMRTTKNVVNNSTMSKTHKSSRNTRHYSTRRIKSNTQSISFRSCLDLISFYSEDTNNLNELITKFKSIKITKEEIFNYISKLFSKLDFYRSLLDFYHSKELVLEEKKSKYDIKVKNIISNNYYNFDELTTKNPKCKQFLEKNETFINKMKNNNNKIIMDKIIDKINKKDEIDNMEENSEVKYNSDNTKIEIDEENIIFKLSKDIINSNKNFFLTCSDLLKDIINTMNIQGDINNIDINKSFVENNNNKINEETEKKNNFEDNKYIQTLKKITEFQKNKDVIISDNYKLLIQYIKSLIKYCRENENVISKEDFDEMNTDLINKFYMKGEIAQQIDKVFIQRFLAKKNTNFNNIYIHFNSLADAVIENVKAIYELINSKENEKYLKENYYSKKIIEELTNKNSNKNYISPIKLSQASVNESQSIDGRSNKMKSMRKFKKIKSAKSVTINKKFFGDKFEELCIDDEDNASIETQSTKKIKIKRKRKVNSMDDKIINKLYTPFLQKTTYLRQLNPNILGIKQMTSSNSKDYHKILKMIGKVDIISNQMNIYNNPLLDTNKLCNNTYNSLVKLIYNNTRKKNKK